MIWRKGSNIVLDLHLIWNCSKFEPKRLESKLHQTEKGEQNAQYSIKYRFQGTYAFIEFCNIYKVWMLLLILSIQFNIF